MRLHPRGALLAAPAAALLSSCIAPQPPTPVDLTAQLEEADPSGLVLVPEELPEEMFVSDAGLKPSEDDPATFWMDVQRRPVGTYRVCVTRDPSGCRDDADIDNLRRGTADGLTWSVHSTSADEAWEPAMTADWRVVDWVDGNEDRPARSDR